MTQPKKSGAPACLGKFSPAEPCLQCDNRSSACHPVRPQEGQSGDTASAACSWEAPMPIHYPQCDIGSSASACLTPRKKTHAAADQSLFLFHGLPAEPCLQLRLVKDDKDTTADTLLDKYQCNLHFSQHHSASPKEARGCCRACIGKSCRCLQSVCAFHCVQ